MHFSPKQFFPVTFLFLLSCSLSKATFQSTKTQFTKGKTVATSYMTLQPYSKIQCVEKCSDENRQNRCSVAGYNKASKTCYLSADSQQALLDTTDDDVGVFFYSEPGLFVFLCVFVRFFLLFVSSFVRSFIRSFVRSFFYSFVSWFVCSFVIPHCENITLVRKLTRVALFTGHV